MKLKNLIHDLTNSNFNFLWNQLNQYLGLIFFLDYFPLCLAETSDKAAELTERGEEILVLG